MKKRSIIFVLVLTAFCCFATSGVFAGEAPRMGKDELKAKLEDPEVVLVDVRSYTDWLLSGDKIRGAVRENYREREGWYAK